MTLVALVRRRLAVARAEDTLRTNDAVHDTARALRREAQVYLNADRPDLAAPYLDEALMWESAAQPVRGL